MKSVPVDFRRRDRRYRDGRVRVVTKTEPMSEPSDIQRKNQREFLVAMAAFVAMVIIAFLLVVYYF